MSILSLARNRLSTALCLASALASGACSAPGQYVWFGSLPAAAVEGRADYLINVGDTVDVRVLDHENVSVKEKVRPDGRIAIPLIGEVEARGKRPSALRAELEGRLKDFYVSPSVTINVVERSADDGSSPRRGGAPRSVPGRSERAPRSRHRPRRRAHRLRFP